MTKKVIQKKLIECNEDLDGISKKLCEVREMEQNNDFVLYHKIFGFKSTISTVFRFFSKKLRPTYAAQSPFLKP